MKADKVIYQGLVLGSCMSLFSRVQEEPRNHWTLTTNLMFSWFLLFGKQVPMLRLVRIFVVSAIVYSLSQNSHHFSEAVGQSQAFVALKPVLQSRIGKFYDETVTQSIMGRNLMNLLPEEISDFIDSKLSMRQI